MSNSNIRPVEYFLFRNYSVAVRDWLRRTVYLSSYPIDNNVTVAFMTPERAFTRFIFPTLNGNTTTPNVSFHLSGMEYVPENSLGFVKDFVGPENDKFKVLDPPLVYRLTYSVTIYTRSAPEMDVLLYQILSKTSLNKKATLFVDGQWVEIHSSDPTNDTTLEPAERQDVIHRWGLELTIPRAYLPVGGVEAEVITSVPEFDLDV